MNKIYIGNYNINKAYLGGDLTIKIYLGDNLVYPIGPHDYSQDYLTIESTSNNNTIYWRSNFSNQGKTISASTDNGSTWTAYTSTNSGSGTTIATLNSGDTIIFKGENATYFESWSIQGIFGSTGQFNVYGNIMSLVYGDNFVGQTTLTSGNTFRGLFSNSELISAENLILPATTLKNSCYTGMFEGCTSLTTAPELPATTLANYCYNGMFRHCTSLTTAPSVLPATTLVNSCYASMFDGCTNLNYIKCLATNISATDCTFQWVIGVANSGTFVKAASMSGWGTGDNGIPTNWTVQNDDGSPYINDNWDDQE